ncbi:MAG: hypothetical protein E5299_00351 [Burkholderia gladioli]|nr:MAG: hypothetical protein E5299_00351 [Burkholderia gladioli]
MPGAAWRNGAVDAIARDGRREWKQHSGYHRRSLAENAMYQFKTLTGHCLWARRRHQPHGGPRSFAIRSYRLNYARPMPWRPHVRFMQQRLISYLSSPEIITTCRSLFHAKTNSLCSLSQAIVFLINSSITAVPSALFDMARIRPSGYAHRDRCPSFRYARFQESPAHPAPG